jgi:hydrogenase-4 component B
VSAARLLLDAVAGLPLLLTALVLLPPARRLLIHTLPFAPLPALAAALLVPVGSVEPLPTTLLGAALMLDGHGRLFLGIGALVWTLAGIYARATIAGERRDRFAGFWLATLSGNMLLFIAADLVSFYLAFALLSLAAFGLVIHSGSQEAMRAGRIYLTLAILGETLLLLGLMIGASAAGSIMIADVRGALAQAPHRDLALALLLAGFGLKAGLVPLHVWLPLAHPAAPVAASAVLSGVIVKAGVFGFVRFLPLEAALPGWSGALVALGLVTAYFGVLVGVFQQRPKTLLAYSTLSQMGLVIVMLGAGLGTPGAAPVLAAVGIYAAHHSLAKGALFLAVGALHDSGGRGRPWLLALTAVTAFAVAGLPFTGGALAKLAIKGPLGDGPAAMLVTLSAVGTTLLMLRFVLLVRRDEAPAHPRPPLRAIPFVLCALAAIGLPWLLFPGAGQGGLAYALGPASLWSAAWPILAGAAVMAAALRSGLAPLVVPEGDLVVPAERIFHRLKRSVLRLRSPDWAPVANRLRAILPERALGGAERLLARWAIAGPALLAVGLALAAAARTGL